MEVTSILKRLFPLNGVTRKCQVERRILKEAFPTHSCSTNLSRIITGFPSPLHVGSTRFVETDEATWLPWASCALSSSRVVLVSSRVGCGCWACSVVVDSGPLLKWSPGVSSTPRVGRQPSTTNSRCPELGGMNEVGRGGVVGPIRHGSISIRR